MRVVLFGSGDFGIPAFQALCDSSHQILSVVTSPDKPQGRNLKLKASPVKEWALQNRQPLFHYPNVNSEESAAALEKLEPDLFIVIAFGVILSKKLLEVPKRTALNVHASLLPKYRGAAPIEWALLNGDSETGISILRMAEKLDAGDVLLQKKTPILPEDTAVTLRQKLSLLGQAAILEALETLEKRTEAFTPQNESISSYARKIKKDDGHIDWKQSAKNIHDRVRALAEWPTAYSYYKGRRLIILEAFPSNLEKASDVPPGTVLKASSKEGLWVAASDNTLEIKKLQAEGKKPLAAKEFLKGFPLKEGEALE